MTEIQKINFNETFAPKSEKQIANSEFVNSVFGRAEITEINNGIEKSDKKEKKSKKEKDPNENIRETKTYYENGQVKTYTKEELRKVHFQQHGDETFSKLLDYKEYDKNDQEIIYTRETKTQGDITEKTYFKNGIKTSYEKYQTKIEHVPQSGDHERKVYLAQERYDESGEVIKTTQDVKTTKDKFREYREVTTYENGRKVSYEKYSAQKEHVPQSGDYETRETLAYEEYDKDGEVIREFDENGKELNPKIGKMSSVKISYR